VALKLGRSGSIVQRRGVGLMSTLINVQAIPQELKVLEQWVNWKTEMRGDKETKIPCEPNGMHARTNTPWTWSPFEICVHALANFNRDSQLKGIGFVLHSGYTGTDLDDCVDPETGQITDPDVERKIRLLNSYTEYSPSRRGLHVINRASKPGARCKTGNFEMYDSDRFFTMTGDHFPRSPTTIEGNQDAVNAVYYEIFGEDNNDHRDNEPTSPIRDNAVANENDARLKDSEVIRKASAAKNSDKFMRLFYDGDTSGYPSKSEADLALCGMLGFWCGHDPEQIDRIVRHSALFREKWDERRGDETYGNITIRNAVAGCGETYDSVSEAVTEAPRSQNSATTVVVSEVPNDDNQKNRYETEHSYCVKNGCLTQAAWKVTNDKKADGSRGAKYEPVETTLSNFDAWIVRAVVVTGDDEQRKLDIAGVRDDGENLPEIRIDADEFTSMKWLALWNGRAVPHAGMGLKDHLRAAIQFLSVERDFPTITVYTHIGWVKIGNAWRYLHAGGAIDANGLDPDVEVDGLQDNLRLYDLPTPPSGDKLREDIQTVISLLEDAHEKKEIAERLVFLDIAKTFRAPLNEVLAIVTSTFLLGRTGRRKTPYNAVWQGFFGSDFSEHALPANWSSTGNANEKMLFQCKDAVCEMDDYRPAGDKRQLGAYGLKGEQVLRGQANKQGKGRMNADRSLAQTYYSRAMLSISGEDLPPGESLLARTTIRSVSDTDIPEAWLTKAQECVQGGVCVRTMAAFLKWLAPQIGTLKESGELEQLRKQKRDEYTEKLPRAEHKRVYTAMADFFIGFEMFVRFAVDVDGADEERADELREIFERAVLDVGTEQAKYIRSAKPEQQFLDGIAAILSSGRGYLCEARTMFNEYSKQEEVPQAPNEPSALGWTYGKEHVQESANSYTLRAEPSWIAKGKQIGWINTTEDESTILLEQNVAFAEFHKLMSEQGVTVTNTRNRLYQLLSEKKLAVTDKDGSGSGKQTKIHGRNVRTIKIDTKRILNVTDDEEDHAKRGADIAKVTQVTDE
jgi:putative DNA primase/helicase